MPNPAIAAWVVLNEIARQEERIRARAATLCICHGGVQRRQASNATESSARIAEQVHVTEL
jgi:hypothetical protein